MWGPTAGRKGPPRHPAIKGWLVLVMCALAAAILTSCPAEETEFMDPGLVPTSAAPAQPAKPDTKPEAPAAAPKAETPVAPAAPQADAPKPEAPKPEPAKTETVKTEVVEQAAAKSAIPDAVGSTEKPEKAEETAAKPQQPREELVPMEAVLNPPLPPEEKALYDLIHGAFQAPGETGARSVLKGRKVQNLSVREAAVQALDRNLRVQIVAHDQELRESVVREAKAAFLPVFNVSAQFKNTNTFERKEELNVIRKLNRKYRRQDNIPGAAPPNDPRPFPVSTQFFDPFALPPGAPGGQIILVDPKDTAHYFVATPKPANRAGMATVEIFQFNAVNPPETLAVAGGNLVDANGNPVGTLVAPQGSALQFFNQHNLKLGYVDPLGRATVLPKLWNYQIASKKKPSDEMVSLGMTIEQQLPWGPALAITVAPTWHRQPYDGFGNDFGRSWFGSFTAAGFVPLPWTKNFGPYSPVDTSIKLAKQDRERSFWDFRAAVNNILREVDLRYLAMVNAIRNVESATANRKSVETLAGLTNELLNAQKVTVYSKDQLDGELQRVKRVEEDAWRAYVSASNAMVAFLNLEPDAVLLPVGYSLGLSQRMPYKAEEARAVALENRPELKSVSASVRAAEITLKFQKVQERPDVSLNGSATWSHTQFPNGDGFRGEGGIGFKSVGSALANTLGNHDVVNETYSGAFNRSLFQRGENARIKIAQGQLDQQQLGQRSVQNNVEQEVADALARLDSAKGALEAAKARVEAARNAYNGGLEQMKLARLTAFELLSKSQDLLSAEFRYTSVLTDYKQAETELLYAQGVLAGQFPERTAPSEFDKYRLNLLRSNQVLQFFSEEKGTKAP